MPHVAARIGTGDCRAIYNVNSRTTSNAAGWNTALCGCTASRVTPGTWLPSVVIEEVSVPAVERGAWPKVRRCCSMACTWSVSGN